MLCKHILDAILLLSYHISIDIHILNMQLLKSLYKFGRTISHSAVLTPIWTQLCFWHAPGVMGMDLTAGPANEAKLLDWLTEWLTDGASEIRARAQLLMQIFSD